MAFSRVFIIILFILGLDITTRGVLITKLYVPGRASHEAPLECKYDLQNDQLYDVKWYKDGQQFYRCLPNGEIVQYPLEGIRVTRTDFAPIGSCTVTLMMLNSKSEGEYKCEVSTEAPTFRTAVKSAKLRVIDISKSVQNNTNTSIRQDPQLSTENEIKNTAASLHISCSTYSFMLAFYCIKNVIY